MKEQTRTHKKEHPTIIKTHAVKETEKNTENIYKENNIHEQNITENKRNK